MSNPRDPREGSTYEVTVRVCAHCLCEISEEGCSYGCDWDFDMNEPDRRKGNVLVRKYRVTKELISEMKA